MRVIAGFVVLAASALWLFPSCQKADKSLYESAERMQERSKYEDAMNKLRFLVSEYPDSKWAPKAYFKMGELQYYYFRKPEAAMDAFVRAAELDKGGATSLAAQRLIADIYQNHMRNYDLAILQYQKILKDYPNLEGPEEYYYLIGKAYFSKRDYKQAIIELKNLADKYPEGKYKEDALYFHAVCHYIGGEPEKAAELFISFLKKHHHGKYDYDAQLGLAMTYEEMEKPDKALEVYQRMMAQYPGRDLLVKKITAVSEKIGRQK